MFSVWLARLAPRLLRKAQQTCFKQRTEWTAAAAVDGYLSEERAMQQEIPNRWGLLWRHIQNYTLQQAAQKYFQQKLRDGAVTIVIVTGSIARTIELRLQGRCCGRCWGCWRSSGCRCCCRRCGCRCRRLLELQPCIRAVPLPP